jgi:hypothetical protein
MLAENRIAPALESLLASIAAPPVPKSDIFDRAAAAPVAAARPPRRYLRYAVAAAVAFAIVFGISPKASLAVIERFVVDSYAAAQRLIGFTPPPPPPRWLEAGMTSQAGSLADIQKVAAFTIVPPAGLPADATLVDIRTEPVLAYSTQTRHWAKGQSNVVFRYRRSNGTSFMLGAESYDPRTGPEPKYMYFAEDLPGGKIALTKLAHFAWRNGDQVMSATEGPGVTPQEIDAIRMAMGGTPLAESDSGRPGGGTIVKFYKLKKP